MMGGGTATEERSVGERSPATTAQQPKKRAETWGQEETRTLISLRRERDSLFNTSKSNKHLWDKISSLMRDKGFDRSPTMCTDKWRNLLKDFKKSHRNHHHSNSSTSFIHDTTIHHTNSTNTKGVVGGKAFSWHRDIEELLRERACVGVGKGASFLGFEDKGIDDTNIPFGPMEASSRPSFNLERRLDHDGHPLSITDTVPANGNSPWNWRETPGDGEPCNSYGGRVITVKWGDYRKRIGIDGTSEAIKEAIKSAFRLRTKRAFWLEDGENIVRALDRDMPLGSYTLHLDEGLTIKVCLYEDPDQIPVHTEDKTFYNESDFHDFISRRGWTFLREYNGFRNIDSMDDLCPGAVYRGKNGVRTRALELISVESSALVPDLAAF